MNRSVIAQRVCAIVMLLSSCGGSPTRPSDDGPFRLSGSINSATIQPGTSAIIAIRLDNISAEPKTLTFGSSCQIQSFIVRRDGGDIVYPGGGGWACLAVITRLDMPAGGAVTQEVLVRAAPDAPYPYVALPPGEYLAYATLESQAYPLRSESIPFTIR